MKKLLALPLTIKTVLTLALTLSVSGLSEAQQNRWGNRAEFTGLYAFGDSLTDTGNLPPDLQLPPPYFDGRRSNGILWVEYLGFALNIPPRKWNNFAYGGASAREVEDSPIPGLQEQLDIFESGLVRKKRADKNALYVVWAGSNDFLDYLANPSQVGIIPAALESTISAVNRLHDLGARKIMVVNLPELGLTPLGVATQAFYDSIPLDINISSLVAEYNSALDSSLDQLGFQTIRVDSAGVLQDAVESPRRYWLRNVTDPYLPFNFPAELPTGTPKGYLFWDIVHPTTHGHFIIAIEAWKTIQRSKIRRYIVRRR